MSDYTVRVNGLFPEVIKESKKVGKGLMEQVRESNHHHYEGLTQERLREVITEVFAERPLPTLQRQLQTGQISTMDYLDLISQQE